MRKVLLIFLCLAVVLAAMLVVAKYGVRLALFKKSDRIEDIATLPEGYCGKGYRAFATKDGLEIEVEQTAGLNVAHFNVSVREGDVYLAPQRISSGGPGRKTFHIGPPAQSLPADWPQRAYWLVEEYYYPLWHSGYRNPSLRKPGKRCRITLSERP